MNVLRAKTGLMVCTWLLILAGAARAQNFIGIDYGPFHKNGQQPSTPIPDSQYINDLSVLSKKFGVIKTYGDDHASRLDRVVPLAAKDFPDLKIYQGVYESPTYNSSGTTTYLDTAISLANAYQNVAAIVVGNECLPGDSNPSISVSQLQQDIQYVRAKLTNKNVKVTTGFSYQGAQNYGPQLANSLDSIMINIYPFYGQVDISDGLSNLTSAYQTFQTEFPDKTVIIGETGWPSAGDNNGASVPSVANEKTFVNQVIANYQTIGSTFLFEGFNEPWLSVQNSWGPHWGLWRSDRSPKFTVK